jgi:hypothetical protein
VAKIPMRGALTAVQCAIVLAAGGAGVESALAAVFVCLRLILLAKIGGEQPPLVPKSLVLFSNTFFMIML